MGRTGTRSVGGLWFLSVCSHVCSHVDTRHVQPRLSYGKKVPSGSARWFLTLRVGFGDGYVRTNELEGAQFKAIEQFPTRSLTDTRGRNVECGSSLVSQDTVITAAHCVYGSSALPQCVSFVDPATGRDIDDLYGVAVAVPDAWNDPNRQDFSGDLALVKLNRPVEDRGFAELADEGWSSRKVAVLGKGLNEEGDVPDHGLEVIVVPVLSREKTTRLLGEAVDVYGDDTMAKDAGKRAEARKKFSYESLEDFEEDHFGAGDEKRDSCQGDSGGPALARFDRNRKRDLIVGVVSYGPSFYGCGETGSFGLYTDVGFHANFIRKVLQEEPGAEGGSTKWRGLGDSPSPRC